MATLDTIAKMLQDMSARLQSVEAKVGSAGGGGGAAPKAAAPAVSGAGLALGAEFDSLAAKWSEVTLKLGKKAKAASTNFAKICKWNSEYLAKTATCKTPTADQLQAFAKKLSTLGNKAEKARLPTRNHEKALHEFVVIFRALISPQPYQNVKDGYEALEFHTNRILVEFKGQSEGDVHREWVAATTGLVKKLQKFCLMNAKTSLKFKGQADPAGDAPAPAATAPPAPAAGGPPPPPPMGAMPPTEYSDAPKKKKKAGGGGMGAMLAAIRKVSVKDGKTEGLRHVKDKDRACKNRDLVKSSVVKAQPKKKKKKVAAKKAVAKVKPPKQYFAAGEGTHYVEHQPSGARITIDITNPREKVYLFKCADCVVTVTGKFKCLSLVMCKKTQVIFGDMISVAEVNNCTSVKLQSLGQCPAFCIDKTDGCLVYLSDKSLDCQFVCSKISECNVSWPDPNSPADDRTWIDKPIPEQYKHHIDLEKKVMTAEISDLYSEQ